ncbi:isoprenylcysteine carboxylmethyltransferase family protein [Mycobacterium sp. 1274756.6]|uniref:methyltransferase family protein n=1 Tax=Mycobacterium sp. 1274756.6 TaxID=1834076 RepID=UPI0007FD8B71|nr:isoprenylcysteine carboxylmethyltransferase family protein [Mycobacterium sp. 1274756.6]OBJ67786.1 hypothetical protein A5643_14820 [Mycobacterium sp. 1274756.6]
MNLQLRVFTASLVGTAVLAVALFLPAGTLDYWRGWVFLAVFAAASLGPSSYFARKHPEVLERRLRVGPRAETRRAQQVIISLSFLVLLAMLVFSVFDHRFGWSPVPAAVSVAGDGLVAVGLGAGMLVVAQNRFAGATIRVEPGQHLVSTGLYGRVRHPMYSGNLLLMAGIPPALGSLWGLVFLLPGTAVLVARILDEEAMLTAELPGYRDYTRRVRYRLVPYLW